MKEKLIVVIMVILWIIMTLFPPQTVQTILILRSDRSTMQIDERMEYRFIVGNREIDASTIYERTSIAFDRLLLQYLILGGAGFAIYFLTSKKDNSD